MCQSPGTKLWQVATAGRIISSSAVADDGTIYVGVCGLQSPGDLSTNGWGYSISPQGATNWIARTYGDVRSSPAIGADGTIYVASVLGYLYALRPDGTTNWIVATGKWPYYSYIGRSPAIGVDGTIYINSVSGYDPRYGYRDQLYAIRPGGTTNWMASLNSLAQNRSQDHILYSSPAIGPDGTIYIGADNYKFYAIDPRGSKKWEHLTGNVIESSAAIAGDTIYFASLDRQFYALDFAGNARWTMTNAVLVVPSSAAVSGEGTIYVQDLDLTYGLYAISPTDSNVWTFTSPGADLCLASPAIAPDATIYLAGWSTLFALNGNQPLMSSSWPMFRGNAKHTARSIQRCVSRPRVLLDGSFAINLTVETGRTYQVEYSANLLEWAELTNFVSNTFSNQFVDATSTNAAQRYYRLKTAVP